MDLSSEQREVANKVLASLDTVSVQTLGGYAGTGKTTLVRYLADRLPSAAIAAYTGKAAHVLRQKGCAATTIHQLIYAPLDNEQAVQLALKEMQQACARGASPGEISALLDVVKEAQKPRFIRKHQLTDAVGNPVRCIIVDEASMVPRPIHEDLLSYRRPLVYVGDHGQLPPVSEQQDTFNLMAEPMYRLETIHRNAGPIAYFAEHLRKGGLPRRYGVSCNILQVLGRGAETADLLKAADQVISPYNADRVRANAKIRCALGYGDTKLVEGERVICLRNDHAAGLFNGQQGTVTRIDWDRMTFDFEDDSGLLHADVELDPEQFGQEKYYFRRGGPHPFDYSYCVTCHKAQGSEWRHVLVLDRGWKSEYPRWAYTAASRARERLTWIAS